MTRGTQVNNNNYYKLLMHYREIYDFMKINHFLKLDTRR